MAKQDYVLKKYVSADSAAEALQKDSSTAVSEVFLVEEKPRNIATSAVGFLTSFPSEFD